MSKYILFGRHLYVTTECPTPRKLSATGFRVERKAGLFTHIKIWCCVNPFSSFWRTGPDRCNWHQAEMQTRLNHPWNVNCVISTLFSSTSYQYGPTAGTNRQPAAPFITACANFWLTATQRQATSKLGAAATTKRRQTFQQDQWHIHFNESLMSGTWFIHDMLNNNNHHKSACTEWHSHPEPCDAPFLPSGQCQLKRVGYRTRLCEILTYKGGCYQLLHHHVSYWYRYA